MIDIIRSLPQGMFWYPLLFFLVIGLVRAVVSVSRGLRLQKGGERHDTDHVVALVSLVARARTDVFAYLELERRCIGLLLEVSGLGAYSMESCRLYVRDSSEGPAQRAVAAHVEANERSRRGGRYDVGGPEDRVNVVLTEIERITEVPIG